MKRIGKYFYKKDGRIVKIYLIDPLLFDPKIDKKFAAQILQNCFIEKENKRVKGFYIPKSSIDKLEISIKYDDQLCINDENYYKIDLGSKGSYRPYGFPCILITNSMKQVEIIQIEL